MRKYILALVAAALFSRTPSPGLAGAQPGTLELLSQNFKDFIVLEGTKESPQRFLYADREHVHLYRVEGGRYRLDWETTNLGGRVSALFVTDLESSGRTEIVIATSRGRIVIYDANGYDLLWENLQDPFETITCMTAANIDRDPQLELIFIANSYLYVYDGVTKAVEFQSPRKMEAQEIILGNVDDDEQAEIILNTGLVIDSRFYNIQFQSEARFGLRIRLLDMNGDGIPEVVGEENDFTLRVYDIYAQREIW